MFGVDPAVLRENPAPLLDALAPGERAALLGRIAAAAAEGTELKFQGCTAGTGNAAPRWVQLSATLLEQNDSHTLWDGIVYEITDLKHAEREIRELTAHLEGVKEAERAAVAREIHDDIGATFFGLKVDLAWLKKRLAHEPAMLERLEGMGAQLDSGVQASQRIVRSLRPAVLDFGVIGAAEWLASDFAKRTGITCSFSSGVEELALAPELGTAVFRVMQESLTNVLRHAGATEVSVRFLAADGEVRLEVRDNGRGLGPEDLSKRTSFGVRGMRERVRDLGGTLDIASTQDGGTQLALRLPLRLSVEAGQA
jgi:signal transduction histidine kinase